MSDGSAGTVVLVHGGFVDGSGWQGVYQQLRKDGYTVSVVQNPDPLTSRRRRCHQACHRRTERARDPRRPFLRWRGDHRGRQDRNVKALVYIAAFIPDAGESVQTLIADLPPGRAADSAAAGWLSVARPGQVPSGIRRRRRWRAGRVHGRLAGPVGPRRRERHDQRSRLAEQAQLVPRHNR